MKKMIFTMMCLGVVSIAAALPPNEKVLKVFNATFASPEQISWYEHADAFEVSFVQAGIRSTVKYDKEGNFVSGMRYYGEQHLPISIVSKLKKKYADKKVFGVTEMTSEEEVKYFVKLEDDKMWISVRVDGNGLIESVEKFRKA